MKKSTFFLAATVFAAGSLAVSCNSSRDKVENAKEDVHEAQRDLTKAEMNYADAIEEYRRESNERIAENERVIAEYKTRIEKEKRTEKNKVERDRIAELETTNEHLKARLRDYKDNGREGWESFKREFDHDMNELGQAMKDMTVNNKD